MSKFEFSVLDTRWIFPYQLSYRKIRNSRWNWHGLTLQSVVLFNVLRSNIWTRHWFCLSFCQFSYFKVVESSCRHTAYCIFVIDLKCGLTARNLISVTGLHTLNTPCLVCVTFRIDLLLFFSSTQRKMKSLWQRRRRSWPWIMLSHQSFKCSATTSWGGCGSEG